jgi:NADPH:quinone reductase-like Zn-dependent oxidoreductase
MKRVQYEQMGKPAQVLKVIDVPAQPLRAGEVRVKVLATPIHPSNLLQIAGEYGVGPTLPAIPGSEGIGCVTETAADVVTLKVGQRVMLVAGSTWQEEIVAPAAAFVGLPEVGDIEQMSMLAVNPLTAHLLLESFVELKPGDWVVQSAANSAVGEYLIQLAKLRGYKSVNVVRRDSLVPELQAQGADVVLVDGPDLSERIRAAIQGAQLSLAIDAVGGETFSRLAGALAYGGTLVSYGSLSRQPLVMNPTSVIFNGVRVLGFWLQKWFQGASSADKQVALGTLIPLVASGQLKVKIDSRFAIADIASAVTRASEPGRSGKVLLTAAAQ